MAEIYLKKLEKIKKSIRSTTRSRSAIPTRDARRSIIARPTRNSRPIRNVRPTRNARPIRNVTPTTSASNDIFLTDLISLSIY